MNLTAGNFSLMNVSRMHMLYIPDILLKTNTHIKNNKLTYKALITELIGDLMENEHK